MDGAAAVTYPSRNRVLSSRSAARLRRLGLRGAAIAYLLGMIALPVAAVVSKGFGNGLGSLRSALATPGAIAAIRLTLITATVTAVINGVMGTLIAYSLVRYRFPGRNVLSTVVDLPLAIPTLVTGVMLRAIYGPAAPIGSLLERLGIHVIFAPLGVEVALLIVTLPFVVRAVQPVLLELDPSEEEAAITLGARGWTTFRKVVLPAIRPAIAAGALLTFARALGEFGAIVIVSGNKTGTLTAPVFIFQLASQFKTAQAAAVASVFFALSFVMVLLTARLLRRKEEL